MNMHAPQKNDIIELRGEGKRQFPRFNRQARVIACVWQTSGMHLKVMPNGLRTPQLFPAEWCRKVGIVKP